MAPKQYFATNDALTKKAWDTKLFKETYVKTYWNKFMSTSMDSVIYVQEEFKKSKGDNITIPLIKKLNVSDTIKDGETINGNLQVIGKASQSISLTCEGIGVEYYGGLSKQRMVFEIDSVAKTMLEGATVDLMDKVIFDKLYASAFTKTFIGKDTPSTALTTANLLTTDIVTIKKLSFIATGAKNGFARTHEPVKPFMVDGKEAFVWLMHDDLLFDLKNDPRYEQWMLEAAERGKSNPLFTGAVAYVDGHIIHSHERCPIYLTGGSGGDVPYGTAVLLGKNAINYLQGPVPETSMETFDHGKRVEYYWELIYGVERSAFESKDWACVGAQFARTRVSDAA